jgi:DNA-binding response OmpR family regulator
MRHKTDPLSPDQSEMLSDALTDEGYTVDAAYSGDAAFNKLTSNHYDLIVLDIRMPGMDGVSVLREFRKKEKNSHVPVIVVSAFATSSDIERYRQTGADLSFSKPYAIDDLLGAIASFVPAMKVHQKNGRKP